MFKLAIIFLLDSQTENSKRKKKTFQINVAFSDKFSLKNHD